MRFWKRPVAHVAAGPLLPGADAQRAMDADAERMRAEAAFEIAIARIARAAATPALGKGMPPASRTGF